MFQLLAPAVNGFWKDLIGKYDIATAVLFAIVLIVVIGLGIGVMVVDRHYGVKLECAVDASLEIKKIEVMAIVAEIEQFQSIRLKEYYEAEWERTLLMFFAGEERQEKEKQEKNLENKSELGLFHKRTPSRRSNNSNKKKKIGRSSSRKTSVADCEDKEKFRLPFKLKSFKHILVLIVFVSGVLGYFGSDFVLQKTYLGNMLETTSQLYNVLGRLKYIEGLHLYSIESIFEVQNWPNNISLIPQAK